MIGDLGRRLRLVFRHTALSPDPAPPADEPVEPDDVEFAAYAEDCVLSGRLRLDAERLSDLLNDHDEYELVDVLAQPLTDSAAVEVKRIIIERDDLLLVQATGPRGNPGRRTRMRQHPVVLQVGPYHVRGLVHVPPGTNPIAGFRGRRTMVPLTDACIEYETPAGRQRRWPSTLVVNRHVVDWIVEADDDAVELPDVPMGGEQGPLLKDFTGQLLVDIVQRPGG